MKFHLARAEGRNLFSGYGSGYVAVNGKRYERSLIVLPDRILDWEPIAFEDLTESVFSRLAELSLEILILGTGARLRFPHPSITKALYSAGTALEVMDTHAGCRTYNILLSEDRRVGAALLVGPQL
jgi:uncharacterized protein